MVNVLKEVRTDSYIVSVKRNATDFIIENSETKRFIVYENHKCYISTNMLARTMFYEVGLYTTHFDT
jgi:hypothetical protein